MKFLNYKFFKRLCDFTFACFLIILFIPIFLLIAFLIKASSREGDIVLDPFSGSFTTSFVAKKLGRKSIGIELQEEYIKIGLRRLNIQQNYNNKELTKELRSFEVPASKQLKMGFN